MAPGNQRRLALQAMAGVALVAAGFRSDAQEVRLPGSFDAWRRRFDERNGEPSPDALLAEGEALLMAGDAQGALEILQRAANMAHTPQIECTITRAQTQAGAYRQALGFGAHAALSHRAFPSAMALYAWLLHAGGQSVIAARLLDDALIRAPGDAVLRLARDELGRPWPLASGPLLEAPLRCAPFAHGSEVAPQVARVAGTAVLLADGRRALVATTLLASEPHAWLRNGLGRTTRATLRGQFGDWTLLGCEEPMSVPALQSAPSPVFAGSPVATCEYASALEGLPAWPVMRQGFAGRMPAQGPRALGMVLPAGPRGGPVFDRAGRLAGLAYPGASGDHLIGPEDLPLGYPVAPPGPAPEMPLDAVYESALLMSLQVLLPRT